MGSDPNSFPGWYGKLPSLGDFAGRRLPQGFLGPWDAWLQDALAASRAQMGPRWLEAFLNSPLWRFALSPGLCGTTAWGGVLMPSVDRVGRYFPLTLAAPVEAAAGWTGLLSQGGWYDTLERTALTSLNVAVTPDALEQALQRAALPAWSLPSSCDGAAALMMRSLQPGMPATTIRLPEAGALDALARHSSLRLLDAQAAGRSLWWTGRPGEPASVMLSTPGLPPAASFSSMMDALV